MDSLSKQVEKSKAKITEMEFNLAVEREVLLRLLAMQNGEHNTDSDKSRPIIADSIVPHIQSVLESQKKPMKVRAILKAIEKEGIEIEGKTEPKRLISSALVRRSDLFERVDRGLYKIREQRGTNKTIE